MNCFDDLVVGTILEQITCSPRFDSPANLFIRLKAGENDYLRGHSKLLQGKKSFETAQSRHSSV